MPFLQNFWDRFSNMTLAQAHDADGPLMELNRAIGSMDVYPEAQKALQDIRDYYQENHSNFNLYYIKVVGKKALHFSNKMAELIGARSNNIEEKKANAKRALNDLDDAFNAFVVNKKNYAFAILVGLFIGTMAGIIVFFSPYAVVPAAIANTALGKKLATTGTIIFSVMGGTLGAGSVYIRKILSSKPSNSLLTGKIKNFHGQANTEINDKSDEITTYGHINLASSAGDELIRKVYETGTDEIYKTPYAGSKGSLGDDLEDDLYEKNFRIYKSP